MRNSAIIVLCCLGCSSAAAMPGAEPAAGLGDHCQEVEAPCIRQWTEMSASERAHLWPYLDEVSRAMHWRSMSTRERSDMRREMSAADRDKLRQLQRAGGGRDVEGDAQAASRRTSAPSSADHGIPRSAHGQRRRPRGLCGRRLGPIDVRTESRTQGRPEIRSQQAKQGKTVVHPQEWAAFFVPPRDAGGSMV